MLAIIPARGGSKGLPGKNIKLLCGKPLIQYSIEAAKKAKGIDAIIVSTDDEAIANVAKSAGAGNLYVFGCVFFYCRQGKDIRRIS